MKHKMYCIFAKESIAKMNGIRGKMATQAGHAYLHAFWDATTPNPNHTTLAEPDILAQKQEQALVNGWTGKMAQENVKGKGNLVDLSVILRKVKIYVYDA